MKSISKVILLSFLIVLFVSPLYVLAADENKPMSYYIANTEYSVCFYYNGRMFACKRAVYWSGSNELTIDYCRLAYNNDPTDINTSRTFYDYGLKRETIPNNSIIIVYKGYFPSRNNITIYPSLDDYEEAIKPKWYEIMWDTLADYFQNPVPFEWFKNLIDRIYGDDNEGGTIAENVTISAPTLAPTPTPIPYSTVVIPKTDIVTGDTVYETNYYYVNPSGTPIITSSPPTNEPSSGGGGGGSTEYVPIGGDPFSIPAVNWLTSATIGDTNYDGVNSINEGMGSIDSIGSEYTDGMNVVQESTGTLPTSWLLLIGIAAAIPLLAGIISRFLGG